MNRNTFRTLEFEAVRAWILSYAGSPMGRARLEGLVPLTEGGAVREALATTTEARRVLETVGKQPYHDLPDVSALLTRAAWEGFALEPRELLDIASFADGATEIGRQLARTEYPRISPARNGSPISACSRPPCGGRCSPPARSPTRLHPAWPRSGGRWCA